MGSEAGPLPDFRAGHQTAHAKQIIVPCNTGMDKAGKLHRSRFRYLQKQRQER